MTGAIIRPSGERLEFEATTRLGLGRDALATQHPVERSADVVDHVQPQAENITIEGVVSETLGGRRPAEAVQVMDAIVQAREPIAIEHPRFGTRFRMICTGYGIEYDNRYRARITATFTQLRVAEARRVEIPPGQPVPVAQDLADDQDAGRQSGETIDPTKDRRAKSIASQLTDWLGGR